MTEKDPKETLGAHWDGQGTKFTIFSQHAEKIELCRFNAANDPQPSAVHALTRDGDYWTLYLENVGPGQLYGYRAEGPFRPDLGHRFNPAKLLVDPYARAITKDTHWHPSLQDQPEGQAAQRHPEDTARYMPKCVVTDDRFDWRGEPSVEIPRDEMVIYECHVKGLTQQHPEIPPDLRGTYLALAQEPVLDHLRRLGVTSIELMPVHHFVNEPHLHRAGLTNYWGYSTLGFFAPHAGYATDDTGAQVIEFKRMVRALHQAGFEVLIDVVYNHTAEGNHLGPTLSWRGLDNAIYYRLRDDDPYRSLDYTGCGNTVAVARPVVRRMVLDSMRYWVEHMRVDGFRFDLAPVLGRNPDDFDPRAEFFEELRQDPILSKVKLIAEPWDVGPHGYRLGHFPSGFQEWNDRYRDTVRGFWRGDGQRVGELATRVAGSRDLFGEHSPSTSINFISCHDGFTLEDLVSYENKHNWNNREGNRDGHHHNLSRNWGAEGPTRSSKFLNLRDRVKRSLLTTLAFSWGVPMLGHGDELGRTQNGNNNAYCQDNPTSWISWDLDARAQRLLEFTSRLFQLRKRYATLWKGEFPGSNRLEWLRPDGSPMTVDDWHDEGTQCLGLHIRPAATEKADDAEFPSLLLLFNGSGERHAFHMPEAGRFHLIVDTTTDRPIEIQATVHMWLEPHSMAVLEQICS